MKKEILFVVLVLLLALSLVVLGCAKPATAPAPAPAPAPTVTVTAPAPALPTVEWNLDSWSPLGAYQNPEIELACERISERTEGGFTITPIWGSALGVKGQDALAALAEGAFEMEFGPLNYWTGDMPMLGVLALPGLYSDLWENFLAKGMLEEEFFRGEFDKTWNSKLLGPVQIMPPSIVWTAEPIRSIEDFKGKTIRGYTAEQASVLDLLGATAVTMPFPEVYSAFQRGVMEGAITSSVGSAAISIWEVCPYATEIVFDFSSPAVLANNDAFAELPPEYQLILVEEFYAANMRIIYKTFVADEENWTVIVDGGLERIKPTPETSAEFAKVAVPMWSKWAQEKGGSAAVALTRVRELLGK